MNWALYEIRSTQNTSNIQMYVYILILDCSGRWSYILYWIVLVKKKKSNVSCYLAKILIQFSIITLMIIENRALWLARSFASSRYNHRAVIITLKASSFPKWQPDLLMFRTRKLISNFIFSNNHKCNYTKTISRLRRLIVK